MSRGARTHVVAGAFLALLGLAAAIPIASSFAQDPAPSAARSAALGSAFTYQGRLDGANGPANGPHDFQFRLYDDLTPGPPDVQVGTTVTAPGIVVVDGLFSATLDFGLGVFNGQARFLEIAAREAGGGSFEVLAPRQPVSPAPYALFADTIYARTVVVRPGSTAAESGQAIIAAMGGITSASASEPWVLKLEPGVYDLGSASLAGKEHVDIEGSGRGATTIQGTGANVILTAANSEVRELTVKGTGATSTAVNVADGTGVRLARINVEVTGTSVVGIELSMGNPILEDVLVVATGGTLPRGIRMSQTDAILSQVVVHSTATAADAHGVEADSSLLTLRNVEFRAVGAAGSNKALVTQFTLLNAAIARLRAGGSTGTAVVWEDNSGQARLKGVTFEAESLGTNTAARIQNPSGGSRIEYGEILATGANSVAVEVGGAGTMIVRFSDLRAQTATIGSVTCAGVVDTLGVFYPDTCP